jgi:hypothetical protein
MKLWRSTEKMMERQQKNEDRDRTNVVWLDCKLMDCKGMKTSKNSHRWRYYNNQISRTTTSLLDWWNSQPVWPRTTTSLLDWQFAKDNHWRQYMYGFSTSGINSVNFVRQGITSHQHNVNFLFTCIWMFSSTRGGWIWAIHIWKATRGVGEYEPSTFERLRGG